MDYEVRYSKGMMICLTVLCIIGEMIFGGGAIYLMVKLLITEEISGDGYGIMIMSACGLWLFFLIVLIVYIYILWQFIYDIDVYTETKMYRTRKNRILFEIEYNNILTIRRGGIWSVCFFCREGYLKSGWNKGVKTFTAYYKRQDIYQIIKIISNKNYNVSVS